MLLNFTLELDKLQPAPPGLHADWKTLSTSLLGVSGLGNTSSITFASHYLFQRMAFLSKCAVLLLKGQAKICCSAWLMF